MWMTMTEMSGNSLTEAMMDVVEESVAQTTKSEYSGTETFLVETDAGKENKVTFVGPPRQV